MDCDDEWLMICLLAASPEWCWALASQLVLLEAEAGGRGDALFGWVYQACLVQHCLQPPAPVLLMSELTNQ